LDLWYTTIAPGQGDERRWNDARVRVFETSATAVDGSPLDRHAIEATLQHLRTTWESGGKTIETLDPQYIITHAAERLGARWKVPVAEAARAYSVAGLIEHPPRINPEATALAKQLHAMGIPLISITNTARRESSWQELFATHRGPKFEWIVTSCEVGRAKPDRGIFLEASKRLGVPPHEIVHVGDRWDLDIEGALGSGFGAVLYRGLWPVYPEGLYPDVRESLGPGDGVHDRPHVPRVDRLAEILRPGLFTWKSPNETTIPSGTEPG
jgi:FMN phosphatase YigB (HAD superfamily)